MTARLPPPPAQGVVIAPAGTVGVWCDTGPAKGNPPLLTPALNEHGSGPWTCTATIRPQQALPPHDRAITTEPYPAIPRYARLSRYEWQRGSSASLEE